MTVSPLNGFSQKVALSCSGAPVQSTCTVSPGSVSLNGTANATASVAVVTAGASACLAHPSFYPSAGSRLGLWLALPGLAGMVLVGGRRRYRGHGRRRKWLALLGVLALTIVWPACGGGGSSSSSSGSGGTPAGNYTVTVTGTYTSGSVTLTHSTKLTLVVN